VAICLLHVGHRRQQGVTWMMPAFLWHRQRHCSLAGSNGGLVTDPGDPTQGRSRLPMSTATRQVPVESRRQMVT